MMLIGYMLSNNAANFIAQAAELHNSIEEILNEDDSIRDENAQKRRMN